jgi:hypothetical protein
VVGSPHGHCRSGLTLGRQLSLMGRPFDAAGLIRYRVQPLEAPFTVSAFVAQ